MLPLVCIDELTVKACFTVADSDVKGATPPTAPPKLAATEFTVRRCAPSTRPLTATLLEVVSVTGACNETLPT